MPTLRNSAGEMPDAWVRVSAGQEPPRGARVILTLDRLMEEGAPEGVAGLGVHLGAAVDVRALEGLLPSLDLVSIEFGSFADGRGFSIARRLRAMGFAGELRASGPVIADQFAALLAVGFDTVETPDALAARQGQDQWAAAKDAVGAVYQSGYRGRSILEARREGRRAA